MSEIEIAEVQKLLWSYKKALPEKEEEEKTERLKQYLQERKIPLDKLRYSFKETCEETHLCAINAVSKITVMAILNRKKAA